MYQLTIEDIKNNEKYQLKVFQGCLTLASPPTIGTNRPVSVAMPSTSLYPLGNKKGENIMLLISLFLHLEELLALMDSHNKSACIEALPSHIRGLIALCNKEIKVVARRYEQELVGIGQELN